MSAHLFALLSALVMLAFMVELLRRRRLREKYAALWIVVAVVVMVGVIFPRMLAGLAALVGVTLPVNLVFAGALLLLLLVCVQLSAELSTSEAESQTLAEEVALLRNRVERLERSDGDGPRPPAVDPGAGGPRG